ncbi:MAG: NAD kinase [Bacteroidaceae bacterium]|nr:NAD kinase [Bacteroidaceae bacterium]
MAQVIAKIALFGNEGQEKARSVALQLYEIAKQFNIELFEPTSGDFTAEIAMCLGGDGTFLDVASKVADKEIPILGINVGHLGFLANYSPDDVSHLFSDLSEGKYIINNHSVLEVSSPQLQLDGYPFALNEVAILKHDMSSMISINTSVDGEFLTTYMADGLIIGTPTGSTAYSLSVGGPIIVPSLNTISLTPVAPHSLNMRPIVISGDSKIEIVISSRSKSFLVSLDGRSHSYHDQVSLIIRKAPYVIRVVTPSEQSFFSTLRSKLMWGR